MGAAKPLPNKNYRWPYSATIKTLKGRYENLALDKQCDAGFYPREQGAPTVRPDYSTCRATAWTYGTRMKAHLLRALGRIARRS